MILIADSGSTKTQWFLIDSAQTVLSVETPGYNPVLLTTDEIRSSLEKHLFPLLEKYRNIVSEIHFYGAGCSSEKIQCSMKQLFADAFPAAKQIAVMSDLWACIHATCGRTPGLCCILGTGSNACVFDGEKISEQLPSLGYILGDEGSGNHIGKSLLKAFFYKEMPPSVSKLFAARYDLEEHSFVKKLYDERKPNRFLASFAPFAADERYTPFMQNLLESCFDEFFRTQVLQFEAHRQLPIHFVGSIAFAFEAELRATAARHNLTLGKVYKSPFPALLDYYYKER